MRLKSIKFSQFEGVPDEWLLPWYTLNQINLFVGRNATGKTRLLRVIGILAELLSGQIRITDFFMSYEVDFEYEGQTIKYLLEIKQGKVYHEELSENGSKPLLRREANGIGQIWSEKPQQMLDFQPPIDKLAVVNRRDKIQHPFLEKFYDWATNTSLFEFSTAMGLNVLSDTDPNALRSNVNLQNPNDVVPIFMDGVKKLGDIFINSIKEDMQRIDYFIEKIFTRPTGLISRSGGQIPQYLVIEEKNLPSSIMQLNISNGMFRALSLLIQINYLILVHKPSCIIIDDIGEGLDFSRSTKLIKLLIEKVQGSQIQLIMSTNDQFVMDAVPLEYWQIIQREGNQLKIYNYHNSKEIFDKFEFTGLGNFDFFTSNYFLRTTPTA